MEYWQRQLVLYTKGHYARTMCEKDARFIAEKHCGIQTHRLTRNMFLSFVQDVATEVTGVSQQGTDILNLLTVISHATVDCPTDISPLAKTVIEKRAHADALCVS